MTLPPRVVTVLCLVQVFLVMAGFLITRALLRIYDGAVVEAMGSYAPPIPGLSQFVRSFGLWFLLVPLAWCLAAIVRSGSDVNSGEVTRSQFLMGVALTASLASTFALSSLYALGVRFGWL